MQSEAEPVVATYFPAAHVLHASCAVASLYCPATHGVHVTAPEPVPVFVSEPGAHSMQLAASFEPVAATYLPASQAMHACTFEAVEYFPAPHAVHFVAPVPVPSLVNDPAAHSVHASSPVVVV